MTQPIDQQTRQAQRFQRLYLRAVYVGSLGQKIVGGNTLVQAPLGVCGVDNTPGNARYRTDIGDPGVQTAASRTLRPYRQCVAFAPVPKTALVPERYRRALVMQARALYRATLVGSGDSIGLDGISVTVFPMDWTVKNLLRPKRGVPNVG